MVKQNLSFFATHPEADHDVGFCYLQNHEDGVYAISSVVHYKFQGRKVSTALLLHAIDFARNEDSVHRLEAFVKPNTSSESIAKKFLIFDFETCVSADGPRKTYMLDVKKTCSD